MHAGQWRKLLLWTHLASSDCRYRAAKSTPMASSEEGVLMSSIQVAGFLAAAPWSPSGLCPSSYSSGTPGMACIKRAPQAEINHALFRCHRSSSSACLCKRECCCLQKSLLLLKQESCTMGGDRSSVCEHLEVGDELRGLRAKGAAVDGLAAALQQQQLIKGLQQSPSTFPLWRPGNIF